MSAFANATLTLIIGVYIVAVLDLVMSRAVARRPLALGNAVAAPLRSAALLTLQQRTTTERPDAALWAIAPGLLVAVAAAALLAVPMTRPSPGTVIASGIVYFGALMALVMVAVYICGWAPNALFPLIGGYRFVAQALSYEMPLALVLIATALPAQSLSVNDIVDSQATLWNVVRQPLGLPLYLIAGLGLAFWGPLGQPDAADLAGGASAEQSGVALLLWRAARAAVLVAVAAMGSAAFLGGWRGPFAPGPLWMIAKTVALLAVMIAAGHLVARVRLERFVIMAWTILIPLALLDVFVAGAIALLGAR